MFAKLEKIISNTSSDTEALGQIAGYIHDEKVKDFETSIGYVDDAIEKLGRALSDNKADYAGWLAALESGEGVQPRLIDIRSKPVVIESIEVQLEGMKRVMEELVAELAELNPSGAE